MGEIGHEFKESGSHLFKASYLSSKALFKVARGIVRKLEELVSMKPKIAIIAFLLILFIGGMIEQGRIVVAEQGNMKLMKDKDDMINKLSLDVKLYKSLSQHKDTVRIQLPPKIIYKQAKIDSI